MRFLRLPIVLLLSAGVTAGREEPRVGCSASLPKDIVSVLKSQFAGWRIKAAWDLELYDRQLWTKSKGDTCPGTASGHFLGPSKRTFAVLLVPENREQRGYKVVVFARPHSGTLFRPIVVEEESNPGGADPVIYRLPPGSYTDTEGDHKIRIRLDGLQVEKMEVSTRIYFWRDGHFEHVTTSD